VPWVAMQLVLVVIVIFWPGSVTYWLGGQKMEDPAVIERKLQNLPFPGGDGPGVMPPLDLGPPKIE
jgi:hypothetical protein